MLQDVNGGELGVTSACYLRSFSGKIMEKLDMQHVHWWAINADITRHLQWDLGRWRR